MTILRVSGRRTLHLGAVVVGKKRSHADTLEGSPLAVWSIWIGSGMVILGACVLLWSTTLKEEPWVTFWSGISATIISVGAAGVLYEAFLKRALIRDIQGSSRLESRLLGAGITHASLESDSVHLKTIFSSATILDIVPSQPLSWHETNFSWLIKLASHRKVKCRVYLPEPTAYAKILEEISSVDPLLRSTAHCSVTFQQYDERWKAATIKNGSTLEVLYFSGYPQHGFIVSDDAAVIEVGDYNAGGSLSQITFAYEGHASSETRDWLKKAIENLNAEGVIGSPPKVRTPSQILPLGSETRGTAGPSEQTETESALAQMDSQ